MSIGESRDVRSSRSFWLLGFLLVLIFFTGGSQRADVQSLQFLRPVSILMTAYGLYTLPRDCWYRHRHVLALIGATVLLVVCHLVPLPPEKWQAFGGREIIRDIDAMNGLTHNWRPLSMVPAATLNALYALSVPIAVCLLAARLGPMDQVRLLLLLIALIILSGTLGLLQAIGVDFQLYAQSSENAGLFANRNHQGVLLAMLFPMLAVAAVWGDAVFNKRIVLICAGALAIITVPLILVTGSRAGLIALVMAIATVPLISFSQKIRPRQGHNRLLATSKYVLSAGLLGVLVWMTVFASRETALIRFEQMEEEIRFPVWASIVDVIPSYLPWGSGVGSYVDVYQIFEPDSLLRPTFSNHAHNEWLEIALTAGLPGLALVAWAVILFFCAARATIGTSGREGGFRWLGLSIVLILAFASTFDYPTRTPIMASVLAIAAVWAASFKEFGSADERR